MRKIIILTLFLAPFFFFDSCTHEPILPDRQISFDTIILPIITNNCQHSGCHGVAGGDEFPLTDYNEIADDEFVSPGKPKDSKLYHVITATSGEDRMPRDPYLPLSNKNIRSIYLWIAQGAKDN